MFTIPIRISKTKFTLVIILQKENLDRMKEADPVEIIKENFGLPWSQMQLENIAVCAPNDDDLKLIINAMKKENLNEIAKMLFKGWKVKEGDYDGLYQKMIKIKDLQ